MNVASVSGFEHSVEYLSQFQSQHFYSGGPKLKRSHDEDEMNREVKRMCNGLSWKLEPNGVDHTTGLINGYPSKSNPAMHVESEINGNVDHPWDHDMEVLCEDTKPMSAVQVEKPSTKLSVPQRCMGSHFM